MFAIEAPKLAPRRRRVGLYFTLHADANLTSGSAPSETIHETGEKV